MSILLLVLIFSLTCPPDSKASIKYSTQGFLRGSFPPGFMWGVSTSAFQIEGASHSGGKGESIWDRFVVEHPEKIADQSNATVSCDSFHKYKEDVQLIKGIGAKYYRLSISWPRILPKGTTEIINKAGLAYYNELIDELVSQGITPVVCLFHWDLPQSIQENGGWLNLETIGMFGEYSRLLYASLGDRVTTWITLNDPYSFCYYGYGTGEWPGGKGSSGVDPYACVHALIMGHALAYHIYDKEFRARQGGVVGIQLDNVWQEGAGGDKGSDAAAVQSNAFRFDWIAYPLFHGVYPPLMRSIIDKKSQEEGRKTSRLPTFDGEWTSKINGSLDFLGINHFTSQIVSYASDNASNASSWEADSGTVRSFREEWPSTGSPWLKVYPAGLRKALQRIKEDYDNPQVIILENGVSELLSLLNDTQRIEYHKGYINELLKAVLIDGSRVTGYFARALLDGFEWGEGYSSKFGIIHVDHGSPNRTRTPKNSAKVLRKIFKENGFPLKMSHALSYSISGWVGGAWAPPILRFYNLI